MHVKICGVTSAVDALAAADLGASAVGLNFVAASPRRIDVARASEIARALHEAHGRRVLVVGVVADRSLDDLRALVRDAGLDCLQLHGHETPELLDALLPHAYKAVRVAGPEDVARAAAFGGEHVLVDAKVEGMLGGSGATFDWSLVRELAKTKKLTLAGGLTKANVARAIAEVSPYCVDVASGVERTPGVKDPAEMRAFIEAVRSAA